jgi:hypothetical protein
VNPPEARSIHFLDEPVEVVFDAEPPYEKKPPCPDGFSWAGREYRVVEKISEWADFERRGRSSRNMRPAHLQTAASRGSLNVGRFFFRVRVQTGQYFDLYYDRAMKNIDERKGQWFIYRELELEPLNPS